MKKTISTESEAIKIISINVSNNKIMAKIYYPKSLKRYFLTNTFFAKYDSDIDLEQADESILIIPFISMIAPIAWAIGVNLYVYKIDREYLNSLRTLKDVFKRFYHQFSCGNEIIAKEVILNKFHNKGVGLLFSSGVDSLSSYIRHKEERPELITVWGTDVPLYATRFFMKVREIVENFSAHEKLNVHFIKTNIYEGINIHLLENKVKIKDWWGKVSHGLMLISLCAPLTIKRMGKILIASTHTKEFKEPWGSHPLIDENIKWADVRIIHDGYELSRFEKIKKYIAKYPEYGSYLRVCYSQYSKYNCGRCEKCLRTIIALIIAGADPRAYNFDLRSDTFRYVKDCLIKGKFKFGKNELFMWRDIQKHIPEDIQLPDPEFKRFLQWFKTFDLSKCKTNKLWHLIWTIQYYFSYNMELRVIFSYLIRTIKSYIGYLNL